MHQFGGEGRKALIPTVGIPTLDDEVLPLHPAALAERFPKCLLGGIARRGSCAAEIPDPIDLPRLLRLDRQRPSDGTGQRGHQEAAAVHAGMVGQAQVGSQCRVPSQRGERDVTECGH